MLKITFICGIMFSILWFRYKAAYHNADNWSNSKPSYSDEEDWDIVKMATYQEIDSSGTISDLAASYVYTFKTELMAMFGHSHCSISAQENAAKEWEDQIVVTAVVELLLSLHTMKRTEEILANAALRVVLDSLGSNSNSESKKTKGEITQKFQRWIVTVNQSMYKDPLLRNEYKEKRKQAAVEIPSSSLAHSCIGVTQQIGRFNKIFMNRALYYKKDVSDEEYQQQMLARAMVELAKEPGERSDLNKVYMSALVEMPNLCSWEECNVLDALRQLLWEMPTLGTKINQTILALEMRDALYQRLPKLIL